MGLPKKGERVPGSGRRKGVANAKTYEARALAERLGVDPLEILFYFASNNWEALGYDSSEQTKVLKDGGTIMVDTISADMRLTAAKEACKYVYPQTRAVELANAEETGFKVIIQDYQSGIKS